MKPVTLVIIQARMSSSRLPGKVLMDIAGKPMLQHVIDRSMQAKSVDRVVLATTSDPSDDILEQFCQQHAVPYHRGSLADVLDRFYQTALLFHADVIVRLTADCPLIDPDLMDRTISVFFGNHSDQQPLEYTHKVELSSAGQPAYDFAANRLPPPWKRTLPIGLDVEVCSFAAMQRAWQEARDTHQREHVMPYLYQGLSFSPAEIPPGEEWYLQQGVTPHGFRVAQLNHFPDYGHHRWTVDTPADLEFVRQVFTHLDDQSNFSWKKLLALLEQKPELTSINAHVPHKSAFDIDLRHSSF
jgi:spore coat polysaccharide biosynthesis protein SpsF